MENISIFFCLLLLFFISIKNIVAAEENDQVYIVYMGGKGLSSPGILRDDQEKLINSLSKRNAVVHIYKHGFTGFAAHLSKEEADLMAKEAGVVSVFPDRILQLHTTRSWYFLNHQNINNYHLLNLHSTAFSKSTANNKGADTIIGLVDTGITPESKSLNDKDMGPIPERWKGTCVGTKDFPPSSCNRKLIGARDFEPFEKTCRDLAGHGSHTATTAAGAPVAGASYYGLGNGTAVGGSPSSRIASYKACMGGGCPSSAILAAMDAAINDGVDILSLSLGASAEVGLKIFQDVVAIGAFHAVEHGVMVVCSAGNDGPYSSSVSNYTPWITTVAASTIDRHFDANVVLGNNKVIKGGAIQFSGLDESPKYPLIDGSSAKEASKNISAFAARNCARDSLDRTKINGKIVLCYNEDSLVYEKTEYIFAEGGVGLILVDDDIESECLQLSDPTLPVSAITSKDAKLIISYIQSNRNPTATIHKSVTKLNYKPAPIIGDFSSRGPSLLAHNLLKPDISAPGVNILAAWSKNSTELVIPGKNKPDYVIISGTSMSCPHVAGIAALVKIQNPTWDHSAIRSAIMTTAVQTNNLGGPITKLPGQKQATPYDFGAGEVNPLNVANPGLIYETQIIDYYLFLCNYGYNLSAIKLIAKKIPDGFSCPKNANKDLITNMNYPSIAVAKFKKSKKVTRTVTNVGENKETVYGVKVDAPKYLNVKVIPEKLHFTKENKRQSFQVIFTAQHEYQSDVFGWITWCNDKYNVRSPFVLSL